MISRLVSPTLPILVFLVLGDACLAQPAGLSPGDKYHLAFVTSSTMTVTVQRSVPPPSFSEFGGVRAADYLVTFQVALGYGAGETPFGLSLSHALTGNPNYGYDQWFNDFFTQLTPAPTFWQAILSDSGLSEEYPTPDCGPAALGCDARDRIKITAPVYNTNGDLVAIDKADFWDQSLLAPIEFDEFGNVQTGNVWSGTTPAGVWGGQSCGEWDNPSSSNSGDIGTIGNTNPGWILNGFNSCNQSARLYAISPELTELQPGDVDSDLDVDAIDFLMLQRGFGIGPTSARLMDGDLDGDGNVDSDDIDVWETNYGLPLSSNAATVPEPGSFLLALAALCSLGRQRLRA